MSHLADDLDLSPEWRAAFAHVEELLGGKVVSARSQGRWRPAWFLDVDPGDGGPLRSVYFRGDRGHFENAVYSLEREMGVLQLLGRHGLPVPEIYGFCEAPRGIVMECCPGRANLGTAQDDEERGTVLDHYMALLAEIHRIPVAEAERLGIAVPRGSEAMALADLDLWEKSFRKRRARPEPGLEFMLRWLKNHKPRRDVEPVLLTGDPAQFVFDRGRVTAILDLELAGAGDPLCDLAGMRSRDLSEPLGDLSRAYQRYAEVTGVPLDRAAIDYHAIRFCVLTPLSMARLVAQPSPHTNFPQYLGWYLVYARIPLELIAEVEGVELDPPTLPAAATSRYTPGFEQLRRQLEQGGADESRDYETDTAFRTAQYLEQVDRFGADLAAQDLDEVSTLLGHAVKNTAEVDEALEKFVLSAGPDDDPALIRLLHRRFARHEKLLEPAMRELAGASLQPIDWSASS